MLKLQVLPSLGKKKQNRQSSGKLATSLLVLNSSHWEELSQQYARGGICSNLQVGGICSYMQVGDICRNMQGGGHSSNMNAGGIFSSMQVGRNCKNMQPGGH